MRALLRVLALTALRRRALIYASVAVALLSWCWMSIDSAHDIQDLRTLATAAFGVAWGVAGAGVLLHRREAAFLDALPVRPTTTWLAAWVAGALPALLMAALVLLPELPVAISGAELDFGREWLSSPASLAAWAVLLALASHAAGLLGRALASGNLLALVVAAGLSLGVTFLAGLASVRPVPILAAATVAASVASWLAFEVGNPTPQRARRRAIAALLTSVVALSSISLARWQARSFTPDEKRSSSDLVGFETSAGLRMVVTTRGAWHGEHVLELDESGKRDVIGDSGELLTSVGDLLLFRERRWSFFGAGPARLIAIDLVTGARHDWGLDRLSDDASHEAPSSCALSPDGRRLATFEKAGAKSPNSMLVLRDENGRELIRRPAGEYAWLFLSGRELLAGWPVPTGRGELKAPATHVVRHELETGRLVDERELPQVVEVASDLERLACLQWERDGRGWTPAVVVVTRDGQAREVVPRSELEGWADQGEGQPGVHNRPSGRGPLARWRVRELSWIAFDGRLERAAWIRRAPEGRLMSHELLVADLTTGESRVLLEKATLPASGLVATREPGNVQLRAVTDDGDAVQVVAQRETLLVDLRTGSRSALAPAGERPTPSPSGRQAAWFQEAGPARSNVLATMSPVDAIPRLVPGVVGFGWAYDGRLLIERQDGVLQLLDLVTRKRTMLLP